MASTLTICVAVFTICILFSGTITPSLLIQEVDARQAAKDTRGNKKGEVCGNKLCLAFKSPKCQLTGSKIDVSNCDYSGMDLSGMKLNHVTAKNVNLSGAKLKGTMLWKVDLTGATLKGADL